MCCRSCDWRCGCGVGGADGVSRFKRIISERELTQFFTPDEAEIVWAAKRTHGRPESLLALLVLLKSCARLGYFPSLDEVPVSVVACVRAAAGLPEDVVPVAGERTAKRYRSWVREYLGLAYDPARAREIAEAAMEEAAPVRASVVDLINVALEELVRAGLELPGFSTLDRMAGSVRTRVEGESCARIAEQVGSVRPRLAGLLVVPGGERRSPFDVIKEPGRRATWSRYRQHGERVDLVDGAGDASAARLHSGALEHAVAHRHLTRELIPSSTGDGPALDLSFASQQWRTTVYAKDLPGMLVRRHFEAMVFTYLVEDLRCGDIAVVGAEDFGTWPAPAPTSSTPILTWTWCGRGGMGRWRRWTAR